MTPRDISGSMSVQPIGCSSWCSSDAVVASSAVVPTVVVIVFFILLWSYRRLLCVIHSSKAAYGGRIISSIKFQEIQYCLPLKSQSTAVNHLSNERHRHIVRFDDGYLCMYNERVIHTSVNRGVALEQDRRYIVSQLFR